MKCKYIYNINFYIIMKMSNKNKLLYSKYKMSMSEVKYILDKYHLDHKFIFHKNICKNCLNYTDKIICYNCYFNFIFYFLVILFFYTYLFKNDFKN